MDYDEIIEQATSQVNEARRLLHAMITSDFRVLFAGADDKARRKLLEIILASNNKALHAWIKEQKFEQRDYSQMTVAELRIVARKCKIPEYQYLDKLDLIIKLEEYDEQLATGLCERD